MAEYEKIKIDLTPEVSLEFKLGSDCGTKQTKPVYLTPDNIARYIGAFIVENGDVIELNQGNMEVYLGKRVHMRTIDGCMNLYYCHHCTGALVYAHQTKMSDAYQRKMMDSMLQSLGLKRR